MKQLTAEEANAVLAEKVMGWHIWENTAKRGSPRVYRSTNGAYEMLFHDWNPATNPEHALQCLKVYAYTCDIGYYRETGYSVEIVALNPDFDVLLDPLPPYRFEGGAYSTNLAHAICNAILSAIGAGQIKEVE